MSPDRSPEHTECPGCARLRRELDVVFARIAVLEAQVRELLAPLQHHSSNSSTPPSASLLNPPKPVAKPLTGQLPRAVLEANLEALAEDFRAALKRGSGCADPKDSAFRDNLLMLDPALWLFAAIDAANNHAERIVRTGVLWRKGAFGYQSESCCQFVQRVLTVVQTLSLPKRSVLNFREESVVAHRAGTPAQA